MPVADDTTGGAPDEARGFILQATYRIENGAPVVHLYGMLEGGGTFLVRDGRETPHFYVRRADATRARELGAARQRDTARQTFAGDPVVRVEVAVPPDTPPLRDRLQEHGIRTFEADVRFAVRYLIDRGIRGGCEIAGPSTPGERITRVFDDPELRPADVEVTPSVLSLDIETDPAGRRLLAIALHGAGARVALAYQNDRLKDTVAGLATEIGDAPLFQCDVSADQDVVNLYEEVGAALGQLSILVHSIAFANRDDLGGGFSKTDREGFRLALDVLGRVGAGGCAVGAGGVATCAVRSTARAG